MTSSRIHNEAFALLQQAVALHQGGRPDRAVPLYDRVLALEPGNGWALFFRGLAAEEQGEFDSAGRIYARAAAAGFAEPDLALARGGLALKRGRWAEAQGHYEQAARAVPEVAALWTNLGLALKRQGLLQEAAIAWREGLRLRRGLPADPAAVLDREEARALRLANRDKVEHDLAQLRHLRAAGRLGPERDAAIGALAVLAERLPRQDARLRELGPAELGAAAGLFNRLLHLGDGSALPGPLLRPEAEAQLAAARELPLVVDDLLTPQALARLDAFLRDSTIWFEAKDHGGHVGAYLEEGLAQPLLLQLAASLQAAMPALLGHLQLAQIWGYSYAAAGTGTEMHADAGTVSVNFWITPTEACLEGGGLILCDGAIPDDWSFADANGPAERLRVWLRRTRPPQRHIPYRGNRLLVFDGRAPHRTEPFRFREGFASRRLNLTFLFDLATGGVAASQWRHPGGSAAR